jgi:hypothetical protein
MHMRKFWDKTSSPNAAIYNWCNTLANKEPLVLVNIEVIRVLPQVPFPDTFLFIMT